MFYVLTDNKQKQKYFPSINSLRIVVYHAKAKTNKKYILNRCKSIIKWVADLFLYQDQDRVSTKCKLIHHKSESFTSFVLCDQITIHRMWFAVRLQKVKNLDDLNFCIWNLTLYIDVLENETFLIGYFFQCWHWHLKKKSLYILFIQTNWYQSKNRNLSILC